MKPKNCQKDVYEYAEYMEVYKYVQEEKHKHKAISDAEKIINGEDEKNILLRFRLALCFGSFG